MTSELGQDQTTSVGQLDRATSIGRSDQATIQFGLIHAEKFNLQKVLFFEKKNNQDR